MPFLRAALIATLAFAAPASASAAGPLAPGMPDRTFAGDGTLRSSLASGFEAAATEVLPLASGRLAVVSSLRTVVRLRPSGVRDPRFGTRGVARVRFYGDGNDQVAALAEDTDGALVAAGTKRRDVLAVRRLLPNGRVDRDFGSGGLVTLETGAFLSSVDAAIAPDGTAFVAAVAVPPFSAGAKRLIVLALDRAGARVAAFGEGGVATMPLDPSSVPFRGKLARLADGSLRHATASYVSDGGVRTHITGLTPEGQPDTAVGPGGVRSLGTLLPLGGAMAASASGRMVLTSIQTRPRRRDRLVVVALKRDGARDSAFGTRGIARITLPFDAYGAEVALRPNGDAAIAMTRLDRPLRPVAALVRRGGMLRPRFGTRGFATVGGFPRSHETAVHTAAIDGLDRLVVGGVTGRFVDDDREDFGRDSVAMTRLRLRKSPLSLPARATVSGRGVMRVRVGCRAAGGCRAALTASRGSLRRRTVLRMRAGTQRVLELRLGQAGVRLASRHFSMRLSVLVSAAGRLEPLAASVRLRRTA